MYNYKCPALLIGLLTMFSCTTTKLDVQKAEAKADSDTAEAYNKADEAALKAESEADLDHLKIETATGVKVDNAYKKAEATEDTALKRTEETRRDEFFDSTTKQLAARRSELQSLKKSKSRSAAASKSILEIETKIDHLDVQLSNLKKSNWDKWEGPRMEISQSISQIDAKYRKLANTN